MGVFRLPGGKSRAEKEAARARRRESRIKFFRYSHMPEILPRVRAIGSKLGHFAYMLAQVFASTRLIPANHPMLTPANIGRYGITDVIATAANGLVLKRENMDQILIFGAVVMALLMIVVQSAAIALFAFFGSAQAADSSMFLTPNPETDLVTKFLSQVFGFKSIFDVPTAIEQPGLYAILGFYSTAMMIFAVLIVVYYVITVVGESAQTGQPFGKRFNGLWAPIRLVLALGLLVPLGGGINAAQYLTLYTAKFGSGLATQGWIKFTENFAKPDKVMSSLSAPAAQDLANQIFANEACRAAYNIINPGSNPVVIRVNAGRKSAPATFTQSDIQFAMGQKVDKIAYVWTTQGPHTDGAATPRCGAVSMNIKTSADNIRTNGTMDLKNRVALGMQNSYMQALSNMVTSLSGSKDAPYVRGSPIYKYVRQFVTINPDPAYQFTDASKAEVQRQFERDLAAAMDTLQRDMNSALDAVNDTLKGGDPTLDSVQGKMQREAAERGWGTAGIYYMEMAKFTQTVLDATSEAEPRQMQIPTDNSSTSCDWWRFWEKEGCDGARQIKTVMDSIPATSSTAMGSATVVPKTNHGGNSVSEMVSGAGITDPFLMIARLLFGDTFFILFDEPTLNPMGKLIEGGSKILEKTRFLVWAYFISQAITVVGTGAAAMMSGAAGAAIGGAALAGGGPAAILGAGAGWVAGAALASTIASAAKLLGGFLWFFMLLGAGAGIVLFYLLPLMPFMYFFFSVVNWVIEVAEAFVSMPLFALSHLRIDGEGLLPQRALDGWMILFGILLRPLMIVVGLIVGSLVFNAGAYYLTSTFKFAIYAYNNEDNGGAVRLVNENLDFSNVSAFGIITYVLIFVYMVYLLANSSFKLIDLIPDKMLRWIGGPTPFTGDRPVELQGMEKMALMGYLAAKDGGNAVNNTVNQMAAGAGKLGKGGKGKGGKGPSVG